MRCSAKHSSGMTGKVIFIVLMFVAAFVLSVVLHSL